VDDVDKAFASISEDYTTLFKENTVLKKKLKLLADTVEDYRSVDEAMRKALITAQNMANDMVAEAEKKCADMLANANNNAMAKVSELSALILAEEKKLADAKAGTAAFVDNMIAMLAAESEKFAALKSAVDVPETTAASVNKEPEKPEVPFDTLEQISKSLEEKVKQEEEELGMTDATEFESEQEEEDEDADMKKVSDTISFPDSADEDDEEEVFEKENKPKRRIEFTELKFGKDYDIKKDK